MKIKNKKILHTDILIIGGGTAGCYAALTIREKSDYSIIIAESEHKAKRMPCSRCQCDKCIHSKGQKA